jgi:GrpB-like predicted nucleotidyltransferase (UPF0157 family)
VFINDEGIVNLFIEPIKISMYLFPHNLQWKKEYAIERQLIVNSFDGAIGLHHIGSTAIEGLYAKDCIDILGVVECLPKTLERKEFLTDLGYLYKGECGISGRAYFSKNFRKVHLHIFKTGDDNIKKHLSFVDTMRADSKLIEQMNRLKIRLHQKYPTDKDSYQLEKQSFYNKLNAIR